MRAWQVVRHGRPTKALELVEVPDPEPGPGEVLVRATASVLNYNEVDGCRGRYLTINPPLPYTLGMECVGEVVAASDGAVGSAAVQLAVAAGARVLATVGDDTKAELVRDLGADEIINYRTTDFAARALELTGGAGIDVCFDGVGGETT